MSCIYCKANDENVVYSREHVIPQLLGTFEQNLTLLNCVCSECNNYFGNTIERIFSEGSIEAIRRLHYRRSGRNDAAMRLNTGNRINFRWQCSGQWNGLLLQLIENNDNFTMLPIYQVGLAQRNDSGYIYVSEDDLSNFNQQLPEEADPSKEAFIISDNEEATERLTGLLHDRGIEINPQNPEPIPGSPDNQIDVETETVIDQIVLRVVAKIALNYLAKTVGSQFVINPDFDSIRAYIRNGTRQPPYRPVELSCVPILEDETRNWRCHTGHLVTVGWSNGGRDIISNVSLFNEITYKIKLVRNYHGIWREIKSGHYFDVENHRISSLHGTNRAFLGR